MTRIYKNAIINIIFSFVLVVWHRFITFAKNKRSFPNNNPNNVAYDKPNY